MIDRLACGHYRPPDEYVHVCFSLPDDFMERVEARVAELTRRLNDEEN